ncbi:hypothetical protein [Trichlorobacter lovleyi]|uniref:Uncharacterized protein n=1 Tax=Trichlorobacter lovleyi (strain ATCC BAA-1151 / DSM 17278 / SZ) TaxID=398767 RepID=B3EBL6_TRIL1|nr:hypothetical protein [Trichlorobacter lovleyi]ACD97055.1 hypothetical protein Glov_3349 [Trichlorobacter lovleyi SZ]
MTVDPPKDEQLESLLQEVSRTLGENRRFLQALKEDRIDEVDDLADQENGEETFEEL